MRNKLIKEIKGYSGIEVVERRRIGGRAETPEMRVATVGCETKSSNNERLTSMTCNDQLTTHTISRVEQPGVT